MASSTDTNDSELLDLEQSGQEYNAKIHIIKRYFLLETKDIQKLCSAANSESEIKTILKFKRTLLHSGKSLHALNQRLTEKAAMLKWTSVLLILKAMVIGGLLNAPNNYVILAGSVLLVVEILGKLIGRIKTFWRVWKSEKDSERLLREIRDKGRTGE